MCLYPKLVANPKYKVNKKNGGIVPFLRDERIGKVPIGCKKCIECRKQKASEWRVRLNEEYRHDQNAIFVTLTFSDESIRRLARKIKKSEGVLPKGYEFDNAVAAKAVRYFCENWRKKHGKSVKHWFITELGHEGTENVHLHGIVWSKDKNAIEKAWRQGWIYFGYSFSEKGINYFTKYVNKIDVDHKEYVSKIFCSAGIGKGYLDRIDSKRNIFSRFGETDELYINRQGFKMALPIYYRNKLYTEEERENLWIEKIDSGVRFVLGTEINVNTESGAKEYYSMLEEARRKNKRLGYGDDSVNWDKIEYENQRRELMIKKRLDEDDNIWYVDFDTGELYKRDD